MLRVIFTLRGFNPVEASSTTARRLDALVRPALGSLKGRWDLETSGPFGSALLRCDAKEAAATDLLPRIRMDATLGSQLALVHDFPLRAIPILELPGAPAEESARSAREEDPTGSGVGAALLGVDDIRDSKTLFGNRLKRFIADDGEEATTVNDNAHVGGDHSTNMASLMAGSTVGRAPGANIRGYRVAYAWNMVRALEHIVAASDVRVVCTGIVGILDDATSHPEDEIHALDAAIQNALLKKNVMLFSAAGNDGDRMGAPATLTSAITVGALLEGDIRSPSWEPTSKPSFLGRAGPYATGVTPTSTLSFSCAATAAVAGAIASWFEKDTTLNWPKVEAIIRHTRKCVIPKPGKCAGMGLFQERAALDEMLARAKRVVVPFSPSVPLRSRSRRIPSR